MSGLRTPIARARGLGSAKDGTAHFWAQRVTGLALVPLLLWFIAGLVAHIGAPHAEVVAWIARPVNTVLLLLAVGAVAWHSALGVQVVVEDYVHTGWAKLAALLALKAAHLAFAAVGAYAVLRIGFGA